MPAPITQVVGLADIAEESRELADQPVTTSSVVRGGVDAEVVQEMLGPAVERVEPSGQDGDAEDDQDHAADRHDHRVVPLDDGERGRHSTEGQRGEEEWDRQTG